MQEFTTPSYTISDAVIQVMVFTRQDFYEYFEAGAHTHLCTIVYTSPLHGTDLLILTLRVL